MQQIALSSTSGEKTAKTADMALLKTAELVGLSAGALILWDSNFEPTLSISYAENAEQKNLLTELENDLFLNLRKSRQLVSAYMSFGGERPISSFTLPVKREEQILGAVIGIRPGRGALVGDDNFLEAVSAVLSMSVVIGLTNEIIEKEKLEAVMATATTVNHEINNPLQAILGTVQLLTKDRTDLDEELVRKLKLIEESGLAITKITHKLMNISEVLLTDYVDGTKMLKLPEDQDSS
jgi:signal transduction histidine kinase